MRIVAHHPAPLRHVPKGRRSPVEGLVRIATPAELTVAAPDSMVRVKGVPGGAYELHVHEGALWRRATLRVPVPGSPFHPRTVKLTPDALAAWLAAPRAPEGAQAEAIAAAFAATPLCAFWNEHGPPYPNSVLHRWETRLSTGDLEPAAARILLDDTERAAADAARFLRDEVRLAGDGVYVRAGLTAAPSAISGECHLECGRDLSVSAPPPLRPDLRGVYPRTFFTGFRGGEDRLGPFLSRLPEGAIGDADLALHANALPRTALALHGLAASKRLDVPAPGDELRALALRGRVGGIRPAEAHAAAALALAYVEALVASPAAKRSIGSDLVRVGHMAEVVRSHVMPRLLAGPAPGAEDVESLAALAR